jgi:hypothetical protein
MPMLSADIIRLDSMHTRTLQIAGLLVVCTAAVLGTGAFTPDPVADSVTIEPTSGPNGDYATIEDGEVTIQIDDTGVNTNSRTLLDSVLIIRNNRTSAVRVHLEDDAPSVSFYDSDSANRQSVSGAVNNVTLAPGETLTVGMRVDLTDTSAGPEMAVRNEVTIVTGIQTVTPPDEDDDEPAATAEPTGSDTPTPTLTGTGTTNSPTASPAENITAADDATATTPPTPATTPDAAGTDAPNESAQAAAVSATPTDDSAPVVPFGVPLWMVGLSVPSALAAGLLVLFVRRRRADQ